MTHFRCLLRGHDWHIAQCLTPDLYVMLKLKHCLNCHKVEWLDL